MYVCTEFMNLGINKRWMHSAYLLVVQQMAWHCRIVMSTVPSFFARNKFVLIVNADKQNDVINMLFSKLYFVSVVLCVEVGLNLK